MFGGWRSIVVERQALQDLIDIEERMQVLAPIGDDNRRGLWIYVHRGSLREQRMVRLLSPLDNSFSEKLTNLNKRLEEILGKEQSPIYKVQGSNGHPRRIPLSTIYVEWE